jgi:hypothetical protein
VSWIGARAPWAGIARVFLDGGPPTDIDLYSPTEELQEPVFTASDLPDASHTLTIEVTGLKNPAATSVNIAVDAFDVALSLFAPTVRRVPETDPSVAYTAGPAGPPGWTLGDRNSVYSGGTAAFATTAGAQATFTFTGTSVRWLGLRGPRNGIARISLDGASAVEVDTFSPIEEYQVVLFQAEGLAADRPHTLTIEATGRKRGGDQCTPAPGPDCSAGSVVVVDAFEVTR